MTASARVWGAILIVLSVMAFYQAATFQFELGVRRFALFLAWSEHPTPDAEEAWRAALAEKRRADVRVRIQAGVIGVALLVPGVWLLRRRVRPWQSPVPAIAGPADNP